MRRRFVGPVVAVVLFSLVGTAVPARAADEYNVDAVHSGVTFKISHLGLSWVHGRFNDFAGSFAIDPDNPGNCSFSLDVKAESVDTNNVKRDGHLRSPDFFNVKQFPNITFKSTAVKSIKDGYEVTGDLTMHGVTKPVTFALVGGRKVEFPKGTPRTGYSTDLTIKRSDFGVGDEKFNAALGDEVHIAIGLEGTKK